MKLNTIGWGENNKKEKCKQSNCKKEGFWDSRILMYQPYCSKECRNKSANKYRKTI